jgi:glycosyltransferase involved in cell wall biosynthesis
VSGRPTVLWYGGFPLGHHNTESERKARAASAAGYDVVYASGVGLRDPRIATLGKAGRLLRSRLDGDGDAEPAAEGALRPAAALVAPPRRPRVMRELNARWLRRQLEDAAGDLRECIVWTRYPSPELVRAFELRRPRAVVYECVDAMDLTPGTAGSWQPVFRRAERRLAALADAIVVPNGHLAERFRALGREPVMLPHGVDLGLFAYSPSAPRRTEHPQIGFVGTLDYKLDLDLLRHVATERPHWRLRLVGPVEEDFGGSALSDLENVSVEPAIPFAEVGRAIAEFDACLMPYADRPLYTASTPIKNLEIMAVGRPAVARPIPALEPYADLLYLASDFDGLLAGLDRALQEDSSELAARRRACAEERSWDRRMDELTSLLDSF